MDRVRLGVASASALLAIVGLMLILAGQAMFGPRQAPQTERDAVAVAERFGVALASEAPDVSGLEDLVTPQYLAQLSAGLPPTVTALAPSGSTVEAARVRVSGADESDEDAAVVLLALDARSSSGAGSAVTRQARWKVDVVRNGDQWLVDGFTAVIAGGTA